jgi:hypothetical protein
MKNYLYEPKNLKNLAKEIEKKLEEKKNSSFFVKIKNLFK